MKPKTTVIAMVCLIIGFILPTLVFAGRLPKDPPIRNKKRIGLKPTVEANKFMVFKKPAVMSKTHSFKKYNSLKTKKYFRIRSTENKIKKGYPPIKHNRVVY
jgi:hypothetical protein